LEDQKLYSKADALQFPLDAKYLESLKKAGIYPLEDGTYTLAVQEFEASRNISDVQSRTVVVTPALPLDGATGVISPVTIKWRAFGELVKYYALTLTDPKGNPTVYKCETATSSALKLTTGKYSWYVTGSAGLTSPPKAPAVQYSFTVK
jgi:hypothetical protein